MPTRLLWLPSDRERAEQEVAAHAKLHGDLDAELDAVMAEMGRVSASVSSGAALSVGVGGSGAATSASETAWGGAALSGHASQTGYDEQWDKYDDYGEYV